MGRRKLSSTALIEKMVDEQLEAHGMVDDSLIEIELAKDARIVREAVSSLVRNRINLHLNKVNKRRGKASLYDICPELMSDLPPKECVLQPMYRINRRRCRLVDMPDADIEKHLVAPRKSTNAKNEEHVRQLEIFMAARRGIWG